MQAVPATTNPLLKVTATIRQGMTGGANSGTIAVELSIENMSHVTAQLPFLCVTDLGFNIRPVDEGKMEKISAEGRRLVQFLLAPGASLRSGETSIDLPADDFLAGRRPAFRRLRSGRRPGPRCAA